MEKMLASQLLSAAKVGEHLAIIPLIRAGVPVDVRDADGWTPLMHAALKGHVEAVKVLLSMGADVNARDGWGNTPLLLAAGCGNAELVRMFLAKGADVWARNNVLSTARMEAEYKGHYEVAYLLRDAEMNSREMAMQAKKLMAPAGGAPRTTGGRTQPQKGRI
jgi:ankyrin repeat protein